MLFKETMKKGKLTVGSEKVKVQVLKKPEGLPTILDNYEGPEIEIYAKTEFEKKVNAKSKSQLTAKKVISQDQSPAEVSTKVSFVYLCIQFSHQTLL